MIVRAYRNQSGQVFIGVCLHTRGDDIAVKFAVPQNGRQPSTMGKKTLPQGRRNGKLSAVESNTENVNRRPWQGTKEES